MIGAAFVGRRDELRAVATIVDDARPARWAIVAGDAGMGKSTLLDEALRLLATGWTVVRAAPTAAEESAAWGTVRLLLSGGLLAHAAAAGVAVGPHVLWATGLGDAAGGDPTRATYEFANLIAGLADRQRLLVVIDDAQSVDPASAAALTIAARGAAHWLIARRTATSGGLVLTGPDFAEATNVEVGPFEEHELAQLAKHWSGRNWNAVELARLRELSGGNPLHARELVRAYPHSGALAAARLPTGLTELFGAKAAALDTEHLDVVAAAALMRRPDLAQLYGAFADRPPAAVEDALAAAEAAGLLRVGALAFEFDHALTRRAVADRLGGVATARIHRRLAEVADDAVTRAWHLGFGTVGPDADVSAELESAARRVAELGDPAHAAELAGRSLDLTPPGDRGTRIRRAGLAGTWAVDAGDWARGMALLEPVVGDLGDRAEGPAARAAYAVAVNRVHGVRPTIDALERVVAAATSDAERAELLAKLVRVNLFVDVLAAEPAAERALAHAEATGDPRSILAARLGLDHVRCMRGDYVELGDYVALWESDPDALSYEAIGFSGRACFEELMQFHDVHDVALASSMATYELGRATGNVSDINNALNQLVGVTRRMGEWAEMRRWCDEFDAMATGNNEELTGVHNADTLWLLAAIGEHALVRASVDHVLAAAEGAAPVGLMPVLADAGFALLALGEPARAADVLLRAKTVADAFHHEDLRSGWFYADLVEALVTVGRVDAADAAATAAERIAARSRWPYCDLEALRCRAMVLLGRGEADRAAAALESAEPVWSTVPRPFEVARAYLLLGAALRRMGTRARAREALDKAEPIFARLGSTPWLLRVADERRLLGGRDRAKDPTALSEAEQQVAELVRAGRSNKEIAAELFVSLRTVETHLTRIYRKAGVRSRAEFLARR